MPVGEEREQDGFLQDDLIEEDDFEIILLTVPPLRAVSPRWLSPSGDDRVHLNSASLL